MSRETWGADLDQMYEGSILEEDQEENEWTAYLFEAGWGSKEFRAKEKLSAADTQWARREFFRLNGYELDGSDWEFWHDWRQWYER